MPNFRTNKPFRDAVTKKVYRAGDVVNITVKRSKEIERKLKTVPGYEDYTLERLMNRGMRYGN